MQRAKLKFMNLFTTICVTRLRQDSGKERHYQASYSPPAGYALFQHSRAKRITRSLKENAAPPFGSRLVPGTMGVWPEMERKKADCRSRWKTFKPWLLARRKQKRPGQRFPAAAPAPERPQSPGQAGGRQGPEGTGCWLWSPSPRPTEEHWDMAKDSDAPYSPLRPQFSPRLIAGPVGAILSGHLPPAKETFAREPKLGHGGTPLLRRNIGHSSFGYRRGKRHSFAGSITPNQMQLLSSLKINIIGAYLQHLSRAPQFCRYFPRVYFLKT